MLLSTLCYIEKDDSYLMLHRVKKVQDVNKDKWIGIGGKFEDKESPEDCLLREVREETGLTLTSWRFRGLITFVNDLYETEYMHLFTADAWTGRLTDCDEGVLEWLPKDRVFDLEIWEGDKLFFELLKADYPFFSLKLEYSGDRLLAYVLDGARFERRKVGVLHDHLQRLLADRGY